MCVEPHKLGEGQTVACRKCWQCRANRVNDLVGRCIAEQTASAASYAVTLTYAGDGPQTAMLRYRDIQLMLKQIRRHGYSVRYIVTGEFGTKKGRAHWHAVLFFSCIGPTGPMPIPRLGNGPWDIRIAQRFNWKPWPHGYAFFQEPDYGGFAYVLKYVLKDLDADVSKGHLAMSKKPPLGHEFFRQLAERHVEQGLAPQDLFYSFPNVFDAKRKRREFLIQGKTRENYLQHFAEQWQEVHGTDCPLSEALMDHWDKQAREDRDKWRDMVYWARAKAQWPKYVRPDAEERHPIGQTWRFSAVWPEGLTYLTPGHVLEVVADKQPREISLEWRSGVLPLIINIEGDVGWLANEEDAAQIFEWMHQVVQPDDPIGL